MKNLGRILIYFSLIAKAMENPLTLYEKSFKVLKENLSKDTIDIISRIYPRFFDEESKLQFTGFKYIFNPAFKIPLKEIDLSRMNLERIPVQLAKQMSNVEKLDLSNNYKIKLNEDWFSYFYDNLNELTLKSCILSDENLKAINKMKSLERLSLSDYTKKLDIKLLTPILKNLKHLNISCSNYSISELEYILNYAEKLESLDFSRNDLSNQASLLSILSSKQNLKSLNLSGCGLNFNDIENIINLSNLEEVDLSYNNVRQSKDDESKDDIKDHRKKLKLYDITNLKNPTYNSMNYTNQETNSKSKLKKINLNYCDLENEVFIKSLFNIEGLEVLKIAKSNLDFIIG